MNITPNTIRKKLTNYYNTSTDYQLCLTDEKKTYKKSITLNK